MLVTTILLLGLTVNHCAKFASADTDACGIEITYRNTSIYETSKLQGLLLKGFRSQREVNSYSARKGGFTSAGDNKQCITVIYNISCGDNTTEVCNRCNLNDKNKTEQIYLWTSFNATSSAGSQLLKLDVYDLRVFGFELCDLYNSEVEFNITLESEEEIEFEPGCNNLEAALADFTTLVRYALTKLIPFFNCT